MRGDPLRRYALGLLACVCLAGCGGLTAGATGSPANSFPHLEIVTLPGKRAFTPDSVTVAGGDVRLLYRNRSDEPHNLTFVRPLDAGTETILEPGDEELLAIRVPETGSYRFICTIHPGMEGTLTVE